MGSIPDLGTKIPHASWPKNQNIKHKQYCNKFKTTLKMVHIKKKKKIKKRESHENTPSLLPTTGSKTAQGQGNLCM